MKSSVTLDRLLEPTTQQNAWQAEALPHDAAFLWVVRRISEQHFSDAHVGSRRSGMRASRFFLSRRKMDDALLGVIAILGGVALSCYVSPM